MDADRKHFSERSAKSIRHEARLREEAGRLLKQVERHESVAIELAEEKTRILTKIQGGFPVDDAKFDELLRNIEREVRLSAVCKEQLATAEAQVELFLAEEERGLPERRAQQEDAARLAREIITKDSQIERSINELRQLLEERGQLSATIGGVCRDLGFRESADWQRLEAILKVLPPSVVLESCSWAARLLGSSEGLVPFFVISKRFEVPETLAHAGIYTFGQTVDLPVGEAQPYLQSEPPAISTVEDFHALEAEASELRYPLQILVTVRNRDREIERRAHPNPIEERAVHSNQLIAAN
ncbi:MAG: hypothetical protein ACRD1I_05175 [Terriglobia bacterium]